MTDSQQIAECIERRSEGFIRASRQIWEFAELRFEEHRSAELLQQHLAAEGFAIERGVAGMSTAFVASYGSGFPIIAMLGEYDALPSSSQKSGVARPEPVEEKGSGHGCGHNLLGVGALAAAVALRHFLEENKLPGTVRYYGCPAEEGGGGKILMLRAGIFADVDAALTWHPSDAHYVFSASTFATQPCLFKFTGRSAHAAKSPHTGRSALDAVELMNVGANFLREHISTEARLHYAILDAGGPAANVVQARATVRYQIRAPHPDTVKDIFERVCDVARGAALMTGTQVEIQQEVGYRNVIPNTTLEGLMQESLELLGLPSVDEEERRFAREIRQTLMDEEKNDHRIPETRGLELAEKLPPYRPHMSIHLASTDVGDVSWLVPTAQYRSAVWAIGTQPHSWQAVSQGISSFAHKGMLQAAKVLALTGVGLLRRPELIDKAKCELKEAVSDGEG